MLKTIPFLLLALSLAFSGSTLSEERFPAREKYPSVKTISLDELYKKRRDVTIVDTRSNYEHATLHIKYSINIPISSFDFSSRIRDLYKKQKKTIVFYCNGHACVKSYNAVLKARKYARVDDTLAFDGGIVDWAKKYPEESVLLNQSPADPAKLISDADFEKHLLKPRPFLDRSNNDCIILDIRDTAQRTERIFAGYEISVDIDDALSVDKHIDESKKSKKPLCIYDAVGKQIRWFQYYLMQKGVSHYYFLEGGAKAFFATPYKELYGN